MKITMKQIREWYQRHYSHLELPEDIEDADDVCAVIWLYEKTRKEIKGE